jgi:tetratricopeptide (TPR) repeat protein
LKSSADPAGALEARLSRIERSLATDPGLAEQLASELLAERPGQPMAMLFQGIARRLAGRPAAAIEGLSELCRNAPDAPLPHLQLGLALRETGDREAALRAMRRAVTLKPDFGDAWLALADLLTAMAEPAGANEAFGHYVIHASQNPRLMEASTHLRENRPAAAEKLLRSQLERHPSDVCALTLLADVAQRYARFDQAEALLARCLELAPGYRLARHNYAVVLRRQEKLPEALRQADRLLQEEPENVEVRSLKAAILMRLGDYDEAIRLFEQVLAAQPDDAGIWASLGHALRTVGRLDECIAAYRKAAALAPTYGEAAWNLANLKTVPITDDELASMRERLGQDNLRPDDRVHFHFAIGKALEDRADFAESFRHYAEGNRLRREIAPYDADDVSEHVRRSIALLTPAFFAERAGWGSASGEPIFVVGLPRAGSTLVEQILGSHPAVEATMELAYIGEIAKGLALNPPAGGEARYPELLAHLDAGACRTLGDRYIESARSQRKERRPFFIDKMPNNFAHLGLIQLILPHARIVDVRRHPLACGLSIFRHVFANGQNFSYSLEDIGRYYRDYVALMDHFDAVLPGRVHRVRYEALVEDTEAEVRRLLAYCRLPFDASCLAFFENPRAVATPSSEQVRRPIYRDALEEWRHYEAWLGPLKAALGPLAADA